MLNIYIYDCDPSSAENLRSICFRYLFSHNYEAQAIYCADNGVPTEIQGIYILVFGKDTRIISEMIKRANSENYIILVVSDISDLLGMIRPSISPSGYLFKPVSYENAVGILNEVYDDYTNCIGKGGRIFHFKIKSKEYSIPFEKILMFESRNKKIIARTEIQEFEFYDTLDSVIEKAPSEFMQIHKSFVVNLDRVVYVDYGDMSLRLDDGSGAIISRTYKGRLREGLAERTGC